MENIIKKIGTDFVPPVQDQTSNESEDISRRFAIKKIAGGVGKALLFNALPSLITLKSKLAEAELAPDQEVIDTMNDLLAKGTEFYVQINVGTGKYTWFIRYNRDGSPKMYRQYNTYGDGTYNEILQEKSGWIPKERWDDTITDYLMWSIRDFRKYSRNKGDICFDGDCYELF